MKNIWLTFILHLMQVCHIKCEYSATMESRFMGHWSSTVCSILVNIQNKILIQTIVLVLSAKPLARSWAHRAQRDTGPSVSATILCKSLWSMSCLQYFTFLYTLWDRLNILLIQKKFWLKSRMSCSQYTLSVISSTSRCKVKSTSTRGPIFCCWTLHIQVVILETGHNFRTSAGG